MANKVTTAGALGRGYILTSLLGEPQFERWPPRLENPTGISFSLPDSILQSGLYRLVVEIGVDD